MFPMVKKGLIWKIDKDGKPEIFTDKLDTPSQIVFDKQGDLIVADSGTHTIKKVFTNGDVELIAGIENQFGGQDGDSKSATFNAPMVWLYMKIKYLLQIRTTIRFV